MTQTSKMAHPEIIQGGMGIAVSGWRLAKSVAMQGQLGVVSGTAIGVVLARCLQNGDPDGDMRRAIQHFPFPEIGKRVLDQYFFEGGKSANQAFKGVPMFSIQPPQSLIELTVLANFVEVFLAKEGHAGLVGINLLEKIQLPTLPSLFGAMLADVDYVLMGAGIPRTIPGILDDLASGKPVKFKLDVEGALPGVEFVSEFDPQNFSGGNLPVLRRPKFLPIISSATLAITLARKSTGRVDGFIVEGATAGGHNAPPRGPMQLSASGEPVYGERDAVDLDKIKALGLPFWLGGSFGAPGKLAEAKALGAVGVQVGTAFAFCRESGLSPDLKQRVLEQCRDGKVRIVTDPSASPTGFPFKVVQLDGTLSDPAEYAERERVCDMGYLRHLYRKADGAVGYRCPSEPVEHYVRKGGDEAETHGRQCLCNGLMANTGLGQIRSGEEMEKPLLTAGDETVRLTQFLKSGESSYSAMDVIETLQS